MEKAPKQQNAQVLTRLLKNLNQGTDPGSIRKEACRLISRLSPSDIATAEQNLVHDGYSARLAGQLSAAFVLLGILEDGNTSIKNRLSRNHILRKVVAEHDLTRCFLEDLREVTDTIIKDAHFTSNSLEFMRLSHIVEHLSAMDEHIDREEDVIFPCLKQFGWDSLCRTALNDHGYIKIAIDNLIRLVGAFRDEKADEFKVRLSSITRYLYPTLHEHLFQEDNILYPVALGIIDDSKVWERIKIICDEIGYCGGHV